MKQEDLRKLQEIQFNYIGTLDINIATRADQKSTMFTMTNYPISRKLIIHKLKWDKNNEAKFKKIEKEIIDLIK